MVSIPLGRNAWQRRYAHEPNIELLNRFFEVNPTTAEQYALLARPGSKFLTNSGFWPVRGFHSAPGFYNGDLFFVAGYGPPDGGDGQMYRYTREGGVLKAINGQVYGSGKPSMAHMTGAGYSRLFVADGILLQYYNGGSHATATLTESGTITNQVIEIGGVHYTWSATLNVNNDGTLGNPWRALLGGNDAESLENMAKALNFDGVRGVDFSQNLGGPNPLVTGNAASSTTLVITSKSDLADANTISTTVPSGSGLAWGGTVMSGADSHALSGVEMPDGQGAKAVASIAGHILVSVANSDRFYWIEPGEVTIDPLNFATAESQPDEILDLMSVGDTVWLLGSGSTESWYPTGSLDAPFAPASGRAYSRGVVEGTTVRVKEQVLLVGTDNVVYSVGGGVQRVSHHGIEERIRRQLEREREA